jgi:hypothetical protein
MRYEKDSLKDYILYRVSEEHFESAVSTDNGFVQCYTNDNNLKIRLHFKVEVFNMGIHYANEEILLYINRRFKTVDDDWTICVNEKRLLEQHKITFYYFSNTYATTLRRVKNIVSKLYHPDFNFDISIYYNTNRKYRGLITLILPEQSDYSVKYSKKYKLYFGSYKNIIVDLFDNFTSILEP